MLTSVDAVIDALGGTAEVARLTRRQPSAVSNWKTRRFIPPEYLMTVSDALSAVGKAADPCVFGFSKEEARA